MDDEIRISKEIFQFSLNRIILNEAIKRLFELQIISPVRIIFQK